MSYVAIPKVIHLTPAFAANHPYTLQLANALRSLGVHLKMVSTKQFLLPVLKFRPVIVHIHWLHSFTETNENYATFFFCLTRIIWLAIQLIIISACGTKIIWTVHELAIPETHHQNLDRLCIKIVSSLTKVIIAHCANAQKQIIESCSLDSADRVKVIPHGNFIEVTENRISRIDARQLLNISESVFVVLFFGLIRPYKGVAEIIEAHKQLKRDDVLLLIVGGSIAHNQECADYMARIESDINGHKNIRLVPEFIAEEQIQIFMNASDTVAFPYQAIMTSGALIMAMGFGKSCIASHIGCIGETLDNKGAFLYELNDKFGLLNSLIACLENKNKLEEMGEHNLSLAQKMNWENIATLTLDAYHNALK